eukprot:8107138-Heterocapsa_arctica.AAC.1
MLREHADNNQFEKRLNTTERTTVIHSGQNNNREDMPNRHGHTKWKCHTQQVFMKDKSEGAEQAWGFDTAQYIFVL